MNKFTLVAETDGMIAGFAELEENGHIDRFYCHKNFVGRGVGTMLYNEIEKKARKQKMDKLFV